MAIFNIAEIDTGVLLQEALKESAFIRAGVKVISIPRGTRESFVQALGESTFATHNYGDASDKAVSDTPVTKVEIKIESLYHAEKFDKYAYNAGSAAEQLIESFVAKVPQAIDRLIAGEIASNAWAGFSGTPAEIDGTAESILAAQHALSDAGYNPGATVLYNQARKLVTEALNENTNRSDLAVRISDGDLIGNSTVFFQNLRAGVLTDGDAIGFTFDPNYTVIAIAAPEELDIITGETDTELALENAIFAKVELRIGIGSLAGTAVPLEYSEPVVEGEGE